MEQEISVPDATTVRKFKEDVLAGPGADGSAMKAEELCAKVTLKAKAGSQAQSLARRTSCRAMRECRGRK